MSDKFETNVRKEILRASNDVPGLFLWTNQVGAGVLTRRGSAQGQYITYGLKVGSADLIGQMEMNLYGSNFGVFVSIETKRASGGVTAEAQEKWRKKVIERGGIAIITSSVEEFLSIFNGQVHPYLFVRGLTEWPIVQAGEWRRR